MQLLTYILKKTKFKSENEHSQAYHRHRFFPAVGRNALCTVYINHAALFKLGSNMDSYCYTWY